MQGTIVLKSSGAKPTLLPSFLMLLGFLEECKGNYKTHDKSARIMSFPQHLCLPMVLQSTVLTMKW